MKNSRSNRVNRNLMLATVAAMTEGQKAPKVKIVEPRGTRIDDTTGLHPDAIHGPKIKVTPSRLPKGKPANFNGKKKMTQHERVTHGRYLFLKKFGAKAYIKKFDK